MRRAALLFVCGLGCNSSPPPPPEPAPVEELAPPVVSAEPDPAPPADRVLQSYTTVFKVNTKDGRAQNISLVASKLADVTVGPGEEFSFNRLVGPRTEEAGFLNAPTIFMGETFEGIGGGTCQVSSTLYAAALYAGLEIIERHPHTRPSTYINPGEDAAVSYPAECAAKLDPRICYDLRFKNQNSFPIRIRAEIGEREEIDGGFTNPGLNEGERSITITLAGAGEVPATIESRWISWNTPPFEKRFRRVSYWKNDRKQLKQQGRPGLEGARRVTWRFPDGHTEKREVISRYAPVPEVWQVGMDWVKPQD